MKIQISKRDLQAAVRVVSHTMDEKADGSISSHYCFRRLDDNHLEILSYAGRVFSSCPAVASFEGDIKPFTLAARRVGLILESLADDTLVEFLPGSKGEVVVRTPRIDIPLMSLDANTFPFWDASFKSAKMTAKISAERLSSALDQASNFIYDDETKNPGVCVAEFDGGHLYSTDTRAVSIVKMPGMEDVKARIFRSDIGKFLTFLATFKDKAPVPEAPSSVENLTADQKADTDKKTEVKKLPPPEVEIFEAENAVFLRRKDGALFGEARFDKAFPKVQVDWNTEDQYVVSVEKSEVASSIKLLMAGAGSEDTAIIFELSGQKLRLSQKAVSNAKLFGIDLPISSFKKQENAEELPDGGFRFSNVYLSRLLNTCSEKNIEFHITRRKATGWVRVRDSRDDGFEHVDQYLTTVVWKKDA